MWLLGAAGLVVAATGGASVAASATEEAAVVAYVAGNDAPPSGDRATVGYLQRQGFEVAVLAESDTTLEVLMMSGADLVIVSSSVLPSELDATIAAATVPMIVLEGYVFDDLGLATRSGETADLWDTVRMANTGGPLEGGLTYHPSVLHTPASLNYGEPGNEAIIAAREDGRRQRPVYFGYEAGAALAEGATPAPARRVAFPFPTYDPNFTNLNGGGRALFDAAIHWAKASDQCNCTLMHSATGVAYEQYRVELHEARQAWTSAENEKRQAQVAAMRAARELAEQKAAEKAYENDPTPENWERLQKETEEAEEAARVAEQEFDEWVEAAAHADQQEAEAAAAYELFTTLKSMLDTCLSVCGPI